MSSDNVNLLVVNSNILSGATYITEKVLLGQYISLSIIGYSDQDLSIVIQFSGDGKNWDYSVTRSKPALSNDLLVTPVLAKWTRLQITNLGLLATTQLRLYVYGTPSNSIISAQIQKIGNLNPEIDVGNLPLTAFGELNVSEMYPKSQYIWTYATNGNMLTRSYATPYGNEIWTWSTAFDTGVGANINFNNGICKFGTGGVANSRALLAGQPFRYQSGQGFSTRFTGYFKQGIKSVAFGNYPTLEYIGIGNYDRATNRPQNGYFFGYGDATLVGTDQATNFGIIWINDGVKTFYPRTVWNVDTCLGNYIMPNIDFNLMNVFQIDLQFLGFGMVRFYVEDPTDGQYKLVHTINRVNQGISPPNVRDPSFCFIMYTELDPATVPVTLEDEIGSSSSVTFLQGNLYIPLQRFSVTGSALAVGAEQAILSIRCDTTFYARANWYGLMMDFLSAAVDGTKSAIINVYRNATLVGAVWTSVYSTLVPLSQDITATYTLGTGTKMLTFLLAKIDQVNEHLDDVHVYLIPGDTITVTAQSTANTDVDVSMSVHIR